ncbi:hypothetical protein IGI66_001760 [Enterococcus sp. AZ048]|uniref:hypothetical protein n=1 Tax=Enterococcus sp. AZ048 TaxID=2774658 RepID=UPI003F26C21B
MNNLKTVLNDYLLRIPLAKMTRLEKLPISDDFVLSDITYHLYHEHGVLDVFWPKEQFNESELSFPLEKEETIIFTKEELKSDLIQNVYKRFYEESGNANDYSKLKIHVVRWNEENNDFKVKMFKFHFAFIYKLS